MKRAAKLALAVAPSIAALATAAQSASAGTPPLVPPDPLSDVAIPDDFVVLTDDTGTITVGVPDSWTDVDTEPAGDTPWISATPDFIGFVGTFDVPGVIFEAVPFTTDTASLARDFGFPDDCVKELVQPYDDGVFAGSHLIDTGCGDDHTTQYHVIAANPDDQAFTALLEIQITEPDQTAILDGILGTFNMVTGLTTPGTPTDPDTMSKSFVDLSNIAGLAPAGESSDPTTTVAVPATRCEPPRVVLLPQLDPGANRPGCPSLPPRLR